MVMLTVGLFYFLKQFSGIDDILNYMRHWQLLGYMILAFFSLGGSFLWTIAAGIASSLGVMDIRVALVVGMVFNYLGDIFLFYLGKYHKQEVLPYFGKQRRKLALSVLIVRKYGTIAIFVQKYLYGIKTLVPVTMALSKYSFSKFSFYNIFASVIFVGSVMLVSYYMGYNAKDKLDTSSLLPWYTLPVTLAVIVGGIWWYFEHLTKRR